MYVYKYVKNKIEMKILAFLTNFLLYLDNTRFSKYIYEFDSEIFYPTLVFFFEKPNLKIISPSPSQFVFYVRVGAG